MGELVGWKDGRSVGQSVYHMFLKRQGSYTSIAPFGALLYVRFFQLFLDLSFHNAVFYTGCAKCLAQSLVHELIYTFIADQAIIKDKHQSEEMKRKREGNDEMK